MTKNGIPQILPQENLLVQPSQEILPQEVLTMVTIRVSETYDLSTKVDKMGMIGIHTPNPNTVRRLYPGLFENFKFVSLDSCDVVCACASVLPADPLQIGTEAGDIAPQDMFNPILYKAVSNDSFNVLETRLYGLPDMAGGPSSVVEGDADASVSGFNDEQLYYGLLSDPEGFRKAMPQQGFEMVGLYPIVHEMLYNYGTVFGPQGENQYPSVVTNYGQGSSSSKVYKMRGASKKMPRCPTHTGFLASDAAEHSGGSYPWPTTYCAMIVTPPAKLHKLYYRLRITWTLTFSECVPITVFEKPVEGWQSVASYVYHSDYAEQSKAMSKTESSCDVRDIDMDLVMTAGK